MTRGNTSHYDDRMLDALGSQRYTEAQILYNRQLHEYEGRLNELDRQRRTLESALSASHYENDLSDAPQSSAESRRMEQFQAATYASQARTAQAAARAESRIARIENSRDSALAELEGNASRRLAELERQVASNSVLDEQRVVVAIANAEAERRTAADIAEERKKIDSIKASTRTAIAGHNHKIEEKRIRIAQLEGEIRSIQASLQEAIAQQDAALKPHLTNLESLEVEAKRLAQVSQRLINPQSASTSMTPADVSKARAEIEAEIAAERARIVANARLEIAEVNADSKVEIASVVAPVVTGRRLYAGSYGDEPTPYVHTPVNQSSNTAVATAKGKASEPAPSTRATAKAAKPEAPVRRAERPVEVVASFEPAAIAVNRSPSRNDVGSVVITSGTAQAGAAAPIVVAGTTRTVYDVVYSYNDIGSFEQFQRYLRAYGIDDFTTTSNDDRNEHIIWVGRFYESDAAARHIDYINRKTATNHAEIRTREVAR